MPFPDEVVSPLAVVDYRPQRPLEFEQLARPAAADPDGVRVTTDGGAPTPAPQPHSMISIMGDPRASP
jgi:hypothetical protein